MDADRANQLREFVTYAKSLKGDEKGEAQVYLDRLFRAFSRGGYKEAGATLEARITNDRGGTSFADLVWKPVVLIEMKKRGEDLSRHLTQAFDYWVRLVPNRPQYVVLCNFDEFRIYDFNRDINDPQDTLTVDELPERYGPLNFLWPTNERPHFKVDREKVTREAADLLAAVYRRLKGRRDVGPGVAQRFILQALVAFFSEDIGLLPKHFFTQLLEECVDPPKAFDLLDGLFRAMNAKEGNKGGRFKPVPYFNGGIFAQSAAVELDPDSEIAILKNAAVYNWSHISPDIFGTIFQHSMDSDERHAMGAHYTSQQDILKIVRPTIVDPFTTALDRCSTLKELAVLRSRLQSLCVLDPACGSGNFLYIAYREMRRIEALILAKENELSKRQSLGQTALGGVSPKQFFGMDILPFAVELAKVTLSLAPKLSSDELHTTERTLPLDNLDANIRAADALITFPDAQNKLTAPQRTEWPQADIIIGNPPFLGAKRLKPERGADYVNAVRHLYPEVPGMADYCVYWFRRSHDHLKPCTAKDPFTGRAGLVGTQNIRNNQSRVGGLDHIVASGTIVEAVENMPWSGEANVHVSIANWVKNVKVSKASDVGPAGNVPMPAPYPSGKARAGAKGKAGKGVPPPAAGGFASEAPAPEKAGDDGESGEDDESARLVPEGKRLWSKVGDRPDSGIDADDTAKSRVVTKGKRGKVRRDKTFELSARECDSINSTLSDQTDVSIAKRLVCNTEPQRVFQGQVPGHEGFILSPAEAKSLIGDDRNNREVIWPFLIGRDVVTGDGHPTRFVIDFQDIDVNAASAFEKPFSRIREHVLPVRQKAASEGMGADGVARSHHALFLKYWWRHSYDRPEMIREIAKLSRYVVCSGVTKRPIFNFISRSVRPDHAVFVFCFADDYSFGLLQGGAHWQWFITKCSKLAERFRYTPPSVFDTFPWPQSPSKKQIRAVAEAGREIRAIRAKDLPTMTGGLRALYRTLELPGKNPLRDAHNVLDAAVLEAYGFSARRDVLKQLLDLNLAVAARIERGESVIAPGVPPSYGDASDLITDDCIKP